MNDKQTPGGPPNRSLEDRGDKPKNVCGGGNVGPEVIESQVNDLRQIVGDARDDEFIRQRAALVDGFARLLPMNEQKRTAMARATLSGFKPLVETFNLSIRPFTTQNLHDIPVADFGRMMGSATTKEQQTQFITCMDLLIQEAIINKISLNDAIVKSMSQLIWGDSLTRLTFGVVGTYISIILARDSLLLFANSVLSTISLGHLTLDQLTLYCAYVYNECTSENLINLLVYLGAGSTDAAKEYLKTLGKFIEVQVQYIVMVIYLLGLQTFSGQGPISQNIQRLLNEIAQPVARANGYCRPGIPNIPNSAAAAAANLQSGLAAVNPAAAAAAPVAAVQEGGRPIWDGSVEAFNLVREGITSFFMHGFNFTATRVADIFSLYGARGPHGQGFFVHLNNALQALSNTGGRAIQARAAVVNQNPNEETNKLIAALMEIRINRETTPRQLEDALGLFSERISQNMLTILREGVRGERVAVTQRGWSFLDQPRFDLLHAVFIQGAQGGGGGVNMERFRSFCQQMPLFASGLTGERVAKRSRHQEISDSQVAAGPGADSMRRMDAEILTADPLTTELLNGVRSRLQSFGESYMGAAGRVAVLAGASGGPTIDPREVIERVTKDNQLRDVYQPSIQGAIENYLEEEFHAERLTQEQRTQIGEELNRRVNALNMDDIRRYIIDQDPRSGVPQTLSVSLGDFFNQSIPEGLQSVRDTVKNAIIRGAGNLTASLYDAVMNSGAATAALARDCMNRFRRGIFVPAHLVAQVQPEEAHAQGPEALLENIDIALDQAVAPPVGDVEVGEVRERPPPLGRFGRNQPNNDDDLGGGGRSRSRKRSASKRTRRKGKQPSKKLKRKSRRYVRRASSRKGRK